MATKIYIVYYSTWGHVATLAEEIKKGADSVPGVEVTVWRVPETLPEELTHHGMLFVPVGYTHGAGMFAMDEVKGGSPYGAGTFAGADGSRTPTDAELALAEHQGKYFAGIAKKLKAVV
uniref:Flavoprotein wrbA n=1 Tax=Aegilops tauschii TaxID=37682 RepID=M8C430_AEGTA